MLFPIMYQNASIQINIFEEISFENPSKYLIAIYLIKYIEITVKYFIKLLPSGKAFGGATIISMKMLEKTFD
jgi:hypothetical protein